MQYGTFNGVLQVNYINYSKPDTKAGELMKQDKPLIDYVNQYRRCDDDVKLADRLWTGAKYLFVIACCVGAWFFILDLAFNAFGGVK